MATRVIPTITTTTQTSFAQQLGQQGSGINTILDVQTDVTNVGDRRVSSAVIPFIRSRNVAFLAEGMKSNINLFATFDGIDVSAHITPATKITLNDIGGFSNVHDYTTNAGSFSNLAARTIGDNLDLSLNCGNVLLGATSGATAVVRYQEARATGATSTNIYVSNVKGTFQSGEVIYSSLNGATLTAIRGTLTAAVTPKTKGEALLTNYAGAAVGIFTIPNVSEMRFRTGSREFVLRDTLLTAATTSATNTYTAAGTLETMQRNYVATRNGVITQNNISDGQRTIIDTWSTSKSTTEDYNVCQSDPLAQTFLVDSPGGMFATKVDLFFATKETGLGTPVHVEIREVVNGIPGYWVAPFSKVYKDPASVNVSTTGSAATTFTFPAPVYLQDGREYALVILSDSNKYTVFISQMGETDIATSQMISTQPTLGVLFKSSNGTTWNADQLQDLKFTLYRASFDTVNTGIVNFSNGPTESLKLSSNPFSIVDGSAIIRVNHPNHQMSATSKVQFSGAVTVGNVTAGTLNAQHIISNVELDSYTIAPGTVANVTTSGGGSVVVATENIQYDTIQVNTSELIFKDTSVNYTIKTTSGKSVHGIEVDYQKDATFSTLNANDNVYFSSPRMIASSLNETYKMSNVKSLEVKALMKTSNNAISPVIDVQRLTAICVNNKINAPTLANTNINAIDKRSVITSSVNVAFSATYNSIYTALANTTEADALRTLSPGKYVNVDKTGTNAGNFLVTGSKVIGTDIHVYVDTASTIIVEAAGVSTTIIQYERFVDEICPMFGTMFDKYISREIILAQPSTYIKLSLAANVPPTANVEIFYKINPVGNAEAMSNINWTKMTPNSPIQKTTGREFNDIVIDVENLPAFDTIQIKVTLSSTSSARVPSCKDLRIIACA